MNTTEPSTSTTVSAQERGENRKVARLRKKSINADNRRIYFGGEN